MRALVIAEVGQAHDGSLGSAHAYIDAAAWAGADFVKFQTHIAEAESHPTEPWRVKFSFQDETRFDYWQRMEFSESQWLGLYEHAKRVGVGFVSSPFSIEAVEMLQRTGIDLWKVASGEMGNYPLLERIAEDGRPVILSSGMSDLTEIRTAISTFHKKNIHVSVLQCTSTYPCPPEQLGLNLISDLRAEFQIPVGLSDHSGSVFAGIAAASLGASIIEVHVTFSRQSFGPDVAASLTIEELKQLVDGVNFVSRALNSIVDKDSALESHLHMRRLFTRSIVTTRFLRTGKIITSEDLTLKKPGTGLPPEMIDGVIGRMVLRDLEANCFLSLDDIE